MLDMRLKGILTNQTRSMVLDFVAYNGNIDVFFYVAIGFDFTTSCSGTSGSMLAGTKRQEQRNQWIILGFLKIVVPNLGLIQMQLVGVLT